MKQSILTGYPKKPINIIKYLKLFFISTREILFSKLILLILPFVFFNFLTYKLQPNFLNDINSIKPNEMGDYLINLYQSNLIPYSFIMLITILNFFISIMLILSIDDFIRNQKIDIKQTFRTATSRFFKVSIVALISVAFAYLPISIILFKINESNQGLFLLSLFLSFFFAVALFFSKIIIVIKNVSIKNALKTSWKLIGFKYFIWFALVYGIIGKIFQYYMNFFKDPTFYLTSLTILMLLVANLLFVPFAYAFKLYLLNDLTLRRNNIKVS